jgi:hypothetical protein
MCWLCITALEAKGAAFLSDGFDSPVGRLNPLNVVELIPRKTALRMVDEQG